VTQSITATLPVKSISPKLFFSMFTTDRLCLLFLNSHPISSSCYI
jgi:hypothetical protein